MIQNGPSINECDWRARRRYARVPIGTQVEIYTRKTIGPPLLGLIDTVSLGGALISSRESFDLQTELAMQFQLPTGPRLYAFGRIIYIQAGRRFGVSFVDLEPDAKLNLETFTTKALGYARRSSRVPHRTHLTIRSCDETGPGQEEPADSVLVNRNGGLLVCRKTYTAGQEVYLWSPERKCGAHARVVFQHTWATTGLSEVGIEFFADQDFWKIDFEKEFD